MTEVEAKGSQAARRDLPSVDELLRTDEGRSCTDALGAAASASASRIVLDQLRDGIGKESAARSRAEFMERGRQALQHHLHTVQRQGLKRVINATGVVIHTNLGRAPLSEGAREALLEATGYTTLEYDLETGKRGRRGRRAEDLLAELTGAEDAVVVNNGAAAAFFVLSVFAGGGEVLVSRGELVEIGGDFRVPDVLESSGATLREVGTTNRTKLSDYKSALSDNTRMLLRVHPSNYRIVGFTATPSRRDLASLAKKHGVLFYEDLGSGALIDLKTLGLVDEPHVSDALAAGADIVSFSGDKLLGGPQSGIVAGRKDIIDQLRKHPLYRILRADKLAYSCLEATLNSYQRGRAVEEVPVLRMLGVDVSEIGSRATRLIDELGTAARFKIGIRDGSSAVGGGAAPAAHLATKLISITHESRSAEQLERGLRMNSIPVIARIERDEVLIDLRTVEASDEAALIAAIASLD
jgi:L-seryl-tRNA(Ser) seleniumtransferase